MARRRYISTDISIDRAVNRLAVRYGDFAALLYTWMIPHAADDCTITADPEELLMIVVPGRRDKDVADIEAAITGMLDEGLILRDPEDPSRLMFPPESFYRYQTYVKESSRREPTEQRTEPHETATNSGKQRKTAENAGEPRETPENAASRARAPLSVSVSPSVSAPSEHTTTARARAREEPTPEAYAVAEILVGAPWVGDEVEDVARAVTRSFRLIPEFRTRDGPLLAEQYVRWRGYRRKPPTDWYRAWLNWLRKERDDGASRQQHPNGARSAHRRGERDPASQMGGDAGGADAYRSGRFGRFVVSTADPAP